MPALTIDPVYLQIALPALGIGLLLGLLVTWLAQRAKFKRQARELELRDLQIKSQATVQAERDAAFEAASGRLARAFAELASQSLRSNSESFLRLAEQNLGTQQEKAKRELSEREKAIQGLVTPIREALHQSHRQIAELEKARSEAYGSIRSQLESMQISQLSLTRETQNLVNALRRPQVRGRWGEITLRRLVELAGMVEHCDFQEQVHTSGEDKVIRPDMIVRMPDNRELVVDVKTPLDAYLEAVEARDDAQRQLGLKRHARNVREHVRALSSKTYWDQFSKSPEFVILFIPGDQFLSAALSRDPMLLDDALNQHVILATPTSFVALLKAVAYGWRQVALAENARRICDLAADLYKRLAVFTGHLARMGQRLGSGVEAYNNAVGSLERQVLPAARRFTELGVQARKELEDLPSVEVAPRTVTPEGEDVLATLPEDETAVDRAPREAPPDAD